jgi:HEAT repeat protein
MDRWGGRRWVAPMIRRWALHMASACLALPVLVGAAAPAVAPTTQTALDALRRQLQSSDPIDRVFAAATLLEKGTPEAAKVLQDLLKGPADQSTRLSILDAVDKRRDERFVEPLLALLNDEDAKVRQRAAVALGNFGDHGVADRIAQFIRDPKTGELAQLTAIEALVRTERREAVAALIDLLDSRSKAVHAAALEALRSMTLADLGDSARAWRDWWRRNRDRVQITSGPRLLEALRRQNQELQDQLRRAERDAVRYALAYESALTDPKERAKFLKELLTSDYADLRAHAADALPTVKGAEGVREALTTLLTDRDSRVVAAAARGLGATSDPAAVPALVSLLTREEPEVRAAAARALGPLKAPDSLNPLAALLDDADESVRQAAVESLGQAQAPEAFEPLLRRLDDPSASVREAAVKAVARFKDPRAAAPLVKLLLTDDKAPRARFFAAQVLADFPGREVDEALIKALQDADAGVRQAAAAGLGKRADPNAVDVLLAHALTDDAPTVRQEALTSALAVLTKVASLPLIDRVSGDLMASRSYAAATQVLGIVDRLAPTAPAGDAALVARLRRREADACFLAENWARAAAVYRALLAAGADRTVQTRLIESLEKSGDFFAAAQARLAAGGTATQPAERSAQYAAVLDLAERAVADRPPEALRILRALRAEQKGPLEADLEARVLKAVAAAADRLDVLAQAAAPRVKDLLGRVGDADPAVVSAAVADLAKLGLPAVPALLDALASPDVQVRTAAITALRAISNTSYDFSPTADESARAAAIQRWRAWFDQQRAVPKPPA